MLFRSLNRTAGFIAWGQMYVWVCAGLFWADMAKSHNPLEQVGGLLGGALVSLGCIVVLFYVSRVEAELNKTEELIDFYKSEAKLWETQARFLGYPAVLEEKLSQLQPKS